MSEIKHHSPILKALLSINPRQAAHSTYIWKWAFKWESILLQLLKLFLYQLIVVAQWNSIIKCVHMILSTDMEWNLLDKKWQLPEVGREISRSHEYRSCRLLIIISVNQFTVLLTAVLSAAQCLHFMIFLLCKQAARLEHFWKNIHAVMVSGYPLVPRHSFLPLVTCKLDWGAERESTPSGSPYIFPRCLLIRGFEQ